jgi:hypothetical protein
MRDATSAASRGRVPTSAVTLVSAATSAEPVRPGGAGAAAACGRCRHFLQTAAALEAALPGLTTLSSAYAAVRADDGLCRLHDRYLAATFRCDRFDAAA